MDRVDRVDRVDASIGIGELADRTGLAPSAIRHYESVGLLAPWRDHAGRRRYDPAAAHVLAFVASCRSAGFALTEIADLLADSDPGHALSRRRFEDQRAELGRRVTELEAARAVLARAAECRCETLAECVLVPAGSTG